jgi:hypothetical protein
MVELFRVSLIQKFFVVRYNFLVKNEILMCQGFAKQFFRNVLEFLGS